MVNCSPNNLLKVKPVDRLETFVGISNRSLVWDFGFFMTFMVFRHENPNFASSSNSILIPAWFIIHY